MLPFVAVAPHHLPEEDFDDEVETYLQVRFDPSTSPQAYDLVVVEGPDQGARVTLDGSRPSPVLIGHSPVCDLRLSDRAVSRRHVSVDAVGHRLRVLDLGSKNEMFINGVATTDAFLAGGELLRLGKTTLRVEKHQSQHDRRLPSSTRFGKLIGASAEMRRLHPLCERLAASDIPLVIEGETGTGKEVLAESLHEQGPRARKPFVVFDCTAVPANLMEAELFGHTRGAFTGAVAARRGVFEQAHGGTLFIDEIGDLDTALQPKLLRAIERSEVRPLGASQPVRVDVRIIAATRRDLDREVQAGRFRDDLFHRLAVGRIELPPLRNRRGDVSVLARFFWKQVAGDDAVASPEVLLRWEDRAWPGNVRELRNAVARHVALGEVAFDRDDMGTPDAFSGAPSSMHAVVSEALNLPLKEAKQRLIAAFEQHYVDKIVDRHGGNVTRAAEAAGIGRRYLQMLRARSGR